MNPTTKITLIVPTKNRPKYLKRLLNYYENTHFQGCICFADSSDPPYFQKNKETIERFSTTINIIQDPCPNLLPGPAAQHALDCLETPYAAWLGDDDFLVTAGLEKAILFLESDAQYSAAWGKAIKIRTKESGVYGEILNCKRIPQIIVQEETGAQRYLNYIHSNLTDKDVLFAVHRATLFKKMFQSISMIEDRLLGKYRLPNALSVINSNLKTLDGLYLIRHTHDQQVKFRERKDPFHWIINPVFSRSLPTFLNIVSQALRAQDGIALEEAKAVMMQGIFFDLTHQLLRVYPRHYPQGPDLLTTYLEHANQELSQDHFKSLKTFMQRVSSKAKRNRFWALYHPKEISLKHLLDPRFPYHEDFMPIYHAITLPIHN